MINYPKGQARHSKGQARINYASRGMSLEDQLNQSNRYYRSRDRAVIHKKPTPIQVVHVDYPKRSASRITEAYYRHASTTDYNGVYRGKYVDFEAKETNNKHSFPIQNIPNHQIQHMEACYKQGGLVFLIIHFKAHGQAYLYPFDRFNLFLKTEDSKSIPYHTLQEDGYLIPRGYNPPLDYLQALDLYIADSEMDT